MEVSNPLKEAPCLLRRPPPWTCLPLRTAALAAAAAVVVVMVSIVAVMVVAVVAGGPPDPTSRFC